MEIDDDMDLGPEMKLAYAIRRFELVSRGHLRNPEETEEEESDE